MSASAESASVDTSSPSVAEVTVVVPARNAEVLLPECLAALRASGVAELIVVDGCSSDQTISIAESFGARVLSDEGRGLPVARAIGAKSAHSRFVLLCDADVIFPEGGVAQLLDEYVAGSYAALQADQLSESGPGYWGRALVHHHRTGRSRRWFGLVATLFDREELLRVGFDPAFVSGEDIELRWRLRELGRPTGVSQQVAVRHRYAGDDWAFARGQFHMDGAGLGLMVRKHGLRGVRLAALPLAAGVRGIALDVVHLRLRHVPYFAAFTWFNYVGMFDAFRDDASAGT